MVRSFIFLCALLIPFNLSFAYLHDNGYDDSRRVRIEIDKSEHTLYVMLGDMIVDKPLIFIFSEVGLFGWLVIVIVASFMASMLPAYRAMRISIRETLAYE